MLSGIDGVICLSGRGSATPVDRRLQAELRRSRIDSVGTLAQAMAAADRPPARFCLRLGRRLLRRHRRSRSDRTGAERRRVPGRAVPAMGGRGRPGASAGVRVVHLRTGLVLRRRRPAGPLKPCSSPASAAGSAGPPVHALDLDHRRGRRDPSSARARRRVRAGESDRAGPVTNAEFTKTLGQMLHRPAVMPAPGFALRLVLGEFAGDVLEGQRAVPGSAFSSTGSVFTSFRILRGRTSTAAL